ncbi:NERD domain-containing protein [Desulfurococcaceae archaeon MEX13E-LK6-19]|nr:NERD domain-containing protein [Desulfurococcaceae archaeon MEX13E-LK6-19]
MISRRRKERKGSWLENHVANRYRKAGYNVRKHVIISKGEIDILAIKRKERLTIEVKSGSQTITSSTMIKLYRKARRINAKPVLFIGPNVNVTISAKELAKKLGIRIKKWKPRS